MSVQTSNTTGQTPSEKFCPTGSTERSVMPAGIATLSAYLSAACADALTTRWRDDIEHDVAVRGGRHRLHEPVRTRSPRTYGTALPGMATYPARFYAKGATPSGRA